MFCVKLTVTKHTRAEVQFEGSGLLVLCQLFNRCFDRFRTRADTMQWWELIWLPLYAQCADSFRASEQRGYEQVYEEDRIRQNIPGIRSASSEFIDESSTVADE